MSTDIDELGPVDYLVIEFPQGEQEYAHLGRTPPGGLPGNEAEATPEASGPQEPAAGEGAPKRVRSEHRLML